MVTGIAISVPPAVSRPHWMVNSPMKCCSAHGDGAHVLPGQHHGEQILVPGGDEDIDAVVTTPGMTSSGIDQPDGLQAAAPSMIGGLVQLAAGSR